MKNLNEKLSAVKAGDHLCIIYKTERQHRHILTQYIRQGLERNEKVFYIVDAHTSDDIVRYLEDDGLRDVKGFISEGKLLFFQSQDTYLKGGYFNPDRMIGTLEAEQAKAVAEGSSALRVTGEMTWVLQKLGGCERLIEYEIKLNKFFPGSRALAICQYDWHKFSPDVLLNVLSTHPVAIIGEEIFKNVYYIPPEQWQDENILSHKLERWIYTLQQLDKNTEEKESVIAEKERLLNAAESSRKALLSMVEDVQETEEHLEFLNRLMDTRQRINSLILKGEHADIFNLLQKACLIIHEIGGYTAAAAGHFDKGTRSLVLTAKAGMTVKQYMEKPVHVQLPENAGCPDPAVQTWLNGQPFIFKNPRESRIFSSIFENGKGLNTGSCIGLPIAIHGELMGVILAVSGRKETFAPHEDETLMEIAKDLALGWEMFMLDAERKQLTEQLIRSEKLAAVGELIAGVAHEINNPLTAMIGLSELLVREKKTNLDEETQKDIASIYQSGLRIHKIVDNLLRFSRQEAPMRKNISVCKIIDTVLNIRDYEMKSRNIRVEKSYRPDIPNIMVDPSQMEQVFLNLIINAEYAMLETERGGTLSIDVSLKGEKAERQEVVIEIADTGPGIPDKVLPKLFNPFFTTKPVGKGTGLGLSVSYGIIKEHGGEIIAGNREQGGAVFTITLPYGGG